MSITIMTDSCADLPEALCQFYGIQVVPLSLVLDGKTLKDGEEISPKELMQKMREGKVPTTSQITTATMKDYFTPYLDTLRVVKKLL